MSAKLNRIGNWLILVGLAVIFGGIMVASSAESVRRCADLRVLKRELRETDGRIAELQRILDAGYMTPSERRRFQRAIAEEKVYRDRAEVRARPRPHMGDFAACIFE